MTRARRSSRTWERHATRASAWSANALGQMSHDVDDDVLGEDERSSKVICVPFCSGKQLRVTEECASSDSDTESATLPDAKAAVCTILRSEDVEAHSSVVAASGGCCG